MHLHRSSAVFLLTASVVQLLFPVVESAPSFVLILTDDQDVELGGLSAMPYTLEFLQGGGKTFQNGYVTTPICCPSRTSLLSGRYGHNIGEQASHDWCGEFTGFAIENETWVNALHDAGYRTHISGKYHNAPPTSYVPKGYDDWFVLLNECQYFNNSFADNGKIVTYGDAPEDYMTSVIGNRSLAFLTEAVKSPQPFFAYIAPHASHMPTTPAPWHMDAALPSMRAPRTPAYNTSGSGKHWVVADLPSLTPAYGDAIDSIFAMRHRCLLSVDDILRDVVSLLEGAGRLDDTYFIYLSDHGYNLGTFRLSVEKFHFLENDVKVPFLMRGPGIAPNSSSTALVTNIDVGTTILELAGVAAIPTDGKSFASVLLEESAPPPPSSSSSSPARDRFIIEYGSWSTGYVVRGPCNSSCGICPPALSQLLDAPSNTYTALRIINATHNLAYGEFRPNGPSHIDHASTNWTECYDLLTDPYQLKNLVYGGGANASFLAALSAELWDIANCIGDSCP